MKRAIIAAGIATCMPLSALADESSTAASPWDIELSASLSIVSGNSETDAFASALRAERDGETWRQTARAEAQKANAENAAGSRETTAERYFASYKLDRKLDDKNYLFNIVTYDKNRFSGFKYEASYALGVGRRLIDSQNHTLDGEFGPGYRIQCVEPESSYNVTNCDNLNEDATARLAARYVWRISSNATFSEEIVTEIGDDNTATSARTSITSRINDSLALRLSHILKHNTRVPAGREKADQELQASLVYSF